MTQVSRRTFVKTGAAATGGVVVAKNFLFGPLDTVAVGTPIALAMGVEDVVPTTCWIGKQDCGMRLTTSPTWTRPPWSPKTMRRATTTFQTSIG